MPVFLYPDDFPHQDFLPFVIGGVTGAAVAALSIDRASALFFIVPALLPLIARLFLDGGEITVACPIRFAPSGIGIMAEGSAELERQMQALCRDYVDQPGLRLQTIESAWTQLAAGRWEPVLTAELRRSLHSLSDSGATFGFDEISSAARVWEQHMRAAFDRPGTPEPAVLAAMHTAAQQLREAIAQAQRSG